MPQTDIDLRREQEATLARPRRAYSRAARLLFASMDKVTGPTTTLAKARLLETLACIPYREWEKKEYGKLTRGAASEQVVRGAQAIVEWGRSAADNEYQHLLVLVEKMKADGQSNPWYLIPPIPWLASWTYVIMAKALAAASLRRAFLFNAEFEDHAEHVYAQFVTEHPEWESQRVENPVVAAYSDAATWADVFRRIMLDERDHMNRSLVEAGRPAEVVPYPGMPSAAPGGSGV